LCWSFEASAAVAVIGVSGTLYAAYKGVAKELWLVLGYFSLMEVLQAYTYLSIDNCDSHGNQIATLLGYIHIAFQPFFINAISMYFIPHHIVKKIAPFVYAICFIAVVLFIINLYPFSWAPKCTIGTTSLCGTKLCSVSGNWHIAWEIPRNQLFDLFFIYYIPAFLIPLVYGSWRFTLYHFIMGPLFSYLLTDNLNEHAAVWCLLSIGFLLIVVKTPIQSFLFVKKFYFWRYPKNLSN